MITKILSYRDLKAWQEGRSLAKLVYLQLRKFPKYEQFGISDQMRRAVVSVPSNIAEGFGRATAKEKNQFYHIAKGSLAELETQSYIAFDIDYIDEKTLNEILQQSDLTSKLLHGLIKSNKERI